MQNYLKEGEEYEDEDQIRKVNVLDIDDGDIIGGSKMIFSDD